MAQSKVEVVATPLSHELLDFPVEFPSESEKEGSRVMTPHRVLPKGERLPKEILQRLRASNDVGVTSGTLEEHQNSQTSQ